MSFNRLYGALRVSQRCGDELVCGASRLACDSRAQPDTEFQLFRSAFVQRQCRPEINRSLVN